MLCNSFLYFFNSNKVKQSFENRKKIKSWLSMWWDQDHAVAVHFTSLFSCVLKQWVAPFTGHLLYTSILSVLQICFVRYIVYFIFIAAIVFIWAWGCITHALFNYWLVGCLFLISPWQVVSVCTGLTIQLVGFHAASRSENSSAGKTIFAKKCLEHMGEIVAVTCCSNKPLQLIA